MQFCFIQYSRVHLAAANEQLRGKTNLDAQSQDVFHIWVALLFEQAFPICMCRRRSAEDPLDALKGERKGLVQRCSMAYQSVD